MAKANRTTSTPRRATAVKARKVASHRPVEWGYENGQQIVIRAAGHCQHDLPADRWRGLRNTIDDMGQVVRAFALGGPPGFVGGRIISSSTSRFFGRLLVACMGVLPTPDRMGDRVTV
jgi:hypothetical protein